MFNFLEEVKNKARKGSVLNDYNVILVSGRLLYVEGHLGLTVITSSSMAIKIKGGGIEISGQWLTITELTQNTLTIEGDIREVRQT